MVNSFLSGHFPMPRQKWFYMNKGNFTEVYTPLLPSNIFQPNFTQNLENSQSFQIVQVKLMTIDLAQGHISNMATKSSFKVPKLAYNWPYLKKPLTYFAHLA